MVPSRVLLLDFSLLSLGLSSRPCSPPCNLLFMSLPVNMVFGSSVRPRPPVVSGPSSQGSQGLSCPIACVNFGDFAENM